MPPLYRGHIPTTSAQKVVVAGAAAVRALANPARADMIAALGEVTGRVALERLRSRLRSSEGGRRLLAERPVVTSAIDTRGCPPGSFGAAYEAFLSRHRFDPDDRSPVALVDDEELAYVVLRYRQVHDFWHVLCGLPPTVLGELGLKWFELVQTGLPVAALSAVFGPLRLGPRQRAKLATKYIPWALREGQRATLLLSVHYEAELETPLDALRASLSLTPAPK
ncbi:hypothetical protein CTAYLR_008366 [Chrysophaeum taylorii]|uniref:Ubiquinone biosynthesis protein COQ4 homolog, mitochondrial n=1 Tax=Chrysophaeum taylorii TaxID=2483200 RepID=A0AAD7XR36_9STRA|nr:hypothetical protein CTAYLR_008366 [Chrysophaeum taylorii]